MIEKEQEHFSASFYFKSLPTPKYVCQNFSNVCHKLLTCIQIVTFVFDVFFLLVTAAAATKCMFSFKLAAQSIKEHHFPRLKKRNTRFWLIRLAKQTDHLILLSFSFTQKSIGRERENVYVLHKKRMTHLPHQYKTTRIHRNKLFPLILFIHVFCKALNNASTWPLQLQRIYIY